MQKSAYRPDIDCLRGVAVLLVVAFHLGAYPFSGGFVGVDIFFVISGFVITRIVYTEAIAGDLSFVRFYERRVRRILPALYILVATVAVLSFFYLLPNEYEQFCKSALAVVTFSSNFLFWQQAGYFDLAAYEKPLLHTWSLAVEEQFYFVFPAVIYAVVRFARQRAFFWIVGIAGASFALNVWTVRHAIDAAFYLAPGRAWEFLLGSLLVIPGIPAPKSYTHRMAALGLGILFIAVAAVLLSTGRIYPGEKALAPCLGAALIIWGNSGSEGNELRSWITRALFYVGTISYALYLWHWPVLIFYERIFGIRPGPIGLTATDRIVIFAVSVALACLSTFLIEDPIRRRVVGATRGSLFSGAALASITVAAFAVSGIVWRGFPARLDSDAEVMARYMHYQIADEYERDACFMFSRQTLADMRPGCLSIVPTQKNILVWGDSAAAHLIPGLRAGSGRFDMHISHASASLCPPVEGFDTPKFPTCRAFNEGILSFIEKANPDAVLMSANWTFYTATPGGYDRAIHMLRQTLASITKHKIPVFLVGPPIQYIDSLPRLLIRYAKPISQGFDATQFIDPGSLELDMQMKREFATAEGVNYISMYDLMCERHKCPVMADPYAPVEWDEFHFTAEGSVLAAQKLLLKIEPFIKAGRQQ